MEERKIEEKLRLREKRYEVDQLMKEKRSEELEALEEVFDKSTLMIVYRLLNQGLLTRIFGVVRAGKESRIYWGLDRKGRDVAVKIFLTTSSEFRRGMLHYIEGDPRFKRVRRDIRSLIYLWAQKEFKNLESAHAVGVRVPRPIMVQGNVLLMEFVGKNGVPAPLLKEVNPTNPATFLKELLKYVKLTYRKAKIVHGDLSEYNTMVWKNRPVIFDWSQAVMVDHPQAHAFLKRDITNLLNHFSKYGLKMKNTEETYRWVVGEVGD